MIKTSAHEILSKATGHMSDRASTYDSPGGERSIHKARVMFNLLTDNQGMTSDERAWLFMVILKLVRSQQGDVRLDNYEDAAAYVALAGESAMQERNVPVPKTGDIQHV